jgi:hypothetical protein
MRLAFLANSFDIVFEIPHPRADSDLPEDPSPVTIRAAELDGASISLTILYEITPNPE